MRKSAGFSLVEAVLSTAIVAGMFVAAMNTLGASGASQYRLGRYQQGLGLAQQLMAEILQQDYLVTPATPVFAGDSTRAKFDEISDYNGWQASPPQYKDGSAVPDTAAFKRTVTIDLVNPKDYQQVVQVDLGSKRIRVTVYKNSETIVTLEAVRTSGFDSLKQ